DALPILGRRRGGLGRPGRAAAFPLAGLHLRPPAGSLLGDPFGRTHRSLAGPHASPIFHERRRKGMKRMIGSMILALLGIFAATNVASACMFFYYQPKAPKALKGSR